MNISVNEAIDLLMKWQVETRIVHCLLIMGGVTLKILGRIDSVDNGIVHISQTKTKTPLGERTFIEVPIRDAETIEYADAAHMRELVISQLKGHDAVLTVTYRSGMIVGLDVLAPLDELLKL